MAIQKNENQGVNPIAAGIAGAVVIAGAVAAVAMTKKENREKVGKAVSDLSEKGKTLAHHAETVVDALQKEQKPLEKKVKTLASKAVKHKQ